MLQLTWAFRTSDTTLINYLSSAHRSVLVFLTADSISYRKEYLIAEVFSITPKYSQKKKIQDLLDEPPVKIKKAHDALTLNNT